MLVRYGRPVADESDVGRTSARTRAPAWILPTPARGAHMPLPLLAVIALIAAGVGGTIALAATLWPNAKGKTVLLLGSNLVGKTTLAEFLAKGTIPESYVR